MTTSDAAKNAALDAITGLVTHLDALDSDGTTSVASARVAVEWDAAASRIADNTNQEDLSINGSSTVFWIGGYTALTAGTQHFRSPAGSTFKRPCLIEATGDLITLTAHGLSNGARVVFEAHDGGSLPTGVSADTFYYVISATTDTFQVSTTEGGSAVTITADGTAYAQDAVPETFGSAGTYRIPAGALDLVAVV